MINNSNSRGTCNAKRLRFSVKEGGAKEFSLLEGSEAGV